MSKMIVLRHRRRSLDQKVIKQMTPKHTADSSISPGSSRARPHNATPQSLSAEPHGGSLRANGSPTPSPARAPSVRNTAGGFRPTAITPQFQPHGGSLRAKRPWHRPDRALPSARTFGAKHSRGLPPNRYYTAISAAWRQPAGKRPCKRLNIALTSARTFGAKHRRGLPPSR